MDTNDTSVLSLLLFVPKLLGPVDSGGNNEDISLIVVVGARSVLNIPAACSS